MPRDNADGFEDDYDVDMDTDDSESTRLCPYCGGHIHEDAQRCPYCEQYISEEDSGSSPKPWWLYVGVVICLAIVFLWIWYAM